MQAVSLSEGVVPLGDFKARAPQHIAQLAEGRPLLVTQNGKPAFVAMSPGDYDSLVSNIMFLQSVARGLVQAERGEESDQAAVEERLRSAGLM